jgi:hypothetical protein
MIKEFYKLGTNVFYSSSARGEWIPATITERHVVRGLDGRWLGYKYVVEWNGLGQEVNHSFKIEMTEDELLNENICSW